jgi:hypothetical protein
VSPRSIASLPSPPSHRLPLIARHDPTRLERGPIMTRMSRFAARWRCGDRRGKTID